VYPVSQVHNPVPAAQLALGSKPQPKVCAVAQQYLEVSSQVPDVHWLLLLHAVPAPSFVLASEASVLVLASEASVAVLASDASVAVLASDASVAVLASEASVAVLASEASVVVLASEASTVASANTSAAASTVTSAVASTVVSAVTSSVPFASLDASTAMGFESSPPLDAASKGVVPSGSPESSVGVDELPPHAVQLTAKATRRHLVPALLNDFRIGHSSRRSRPLAASCTSRRHARGRDTKGRRLRSARDPFLAEARPRRSARRGRSRSHSTAAGKQLKHDHDQGGEQQQVNESGRHVERYETKTPYHDEHNG
jgi:hypothetical protein